MSRNAPNCNIGSPCGRKCQPKRFNCPSEQGKADGANLDKVSSLLGAGGGGGGSAESMKYGVGDLQEIFEEADNLINPATKKANREYIKGLPKEEQRQARKDLMAEEEKAWVYARAHRLKAKLEKSGDNPEQLEELNNYLIGIANKDEEVTAAAKDFLDARTAAKRDGAEQKSVSEKSSKNLETLSKEISKKVESEEKEVEPKKAESGEEAKSLSSLRQPQEGQERFNALSPEEQKEAKEKLDKRVSDLEYALKEGAGRTLDEPYRTQAQEELDYLKQENGVENYLAQNEAILELREKAREIQNSPERKAAEEKIKREEGVDDQTVQEARAALDDDPSTTDEDRQELEDRIEASNRRYSKRVKEELESEEEKLVREHGTTATEINKSVLHNRLDEANKREKEERKEVQNFERDVRGHKNDADKIADDGLAALAGGYRAQRGDIEKAIQNAKEAGNADLQEKLENSLEILEKYEKREELFEQFKNGNLSQEEREKIIEEAGVLFDELKVLYMGNRF